MKTPASARLLALLLASAAAIHLSAQQTEADRKLFEQLKSKAEKGDAEAQFSLGVAYHEGNGVRRDASEAFKWTRKAAEQGDAVAQCNLGASYQAGDGVTKDSAEAAKWFRKAAEQGNAWAQGCLGAFYGAGNGVRKDPVEAMKWTRKAAEQGDIKCQLMVGLSYQGGVGVERDSVQAAKWFREAAEQGNADAQSCLAACYAEGDGVTKDYVEAYKWFNLISAQGDDLAKENLSRIELLMTKDQIADAQRYAREFRPRKVLSSGSSASRELFTDSRPIASGTGFFITEDGFLVTSEHVVKEAAQVRLVTSAGIIAARVVKVDAANDLALLKAEGRFAALPVVASRGMRLGSTVATVGFPNVKPARVRAQAGPGRNRRALRRWMTRGIFKSAWSLRTATMQPGNSGGALVDEHGNVVGVVSAKLSARAALAASGALPENVNYAVKSSFLLGFLEAVPEVSAKLKEARTAERKFEDVVKDAEQAAVLVLVY